MEYVCLCTSKMLHFQGFLENDALNTSLLKNVPTLYNLEPNHVLFSNTINQSKPCAEEEGDLEVCQLLQQ